MSKTRFAMAAALALTAALGTGAAHARGGDVQWSVTIGAPLYLPPLPVPVFGVPVPVYRQPAPIYRPALAYPVARYQAPTYWDRDGDGIPNRYDARYSPRWDRDGDGVPNRYDRHDRNPWRR
jgi:hypothetical protein